MAWYDVRGWQLLQWVALRFEAWADWLDSFSEAYSRAWPLSLVVAYVARPGALYLDGLALDLKDFANRYDNVGDFVYDMLAGSLLDNLIHDIWGDWWSFTTDPWQFILYQVSKLNSPVIYWLTYPLEELERWVLDRFPNARTLLDDPKQWAFDRLVDFWPDFYWLWNDPVYTIKGYVAGGSPSVMLFLDDPKQWAKEQIADLLSVPMSFFDDPWGWLLYMVKVKLDERHEYYTRWIYDFGEHLLRFFVEGEW